MIKKIRKHAFLFSELVKRDFKKKYKRSYLGALWSLFSPLLSLFVMRLVFTHIFGRGIEHYSTYLFCGNLVFSYFSESTSQGMSSLLANKAIFTKVSLPKSLFLFSKNAQTFINFLLTLAVFFLFCILDGITPSPAMLLLPYPIICLTVFNIGVGAVLASAFIFFRDVQYLYSVLLQLIMYVSAIFYSIEPYPPLVRSLFNLNPVYLSIRYFREAVIDGEIPSPEVHLLMLLFSAAAAALGYLVYKKSERKFLYYV